MSAVGQLAVGIFPYYWLFTRLGASRPLPAAPTIVAFDLVLPSSLNVVFCPQPYGRATQDHAFGLVEFPRIQPAEQCLIADANRRRYFLGRVPSHNYDFTQITALGADYCLIDRANTHNRIVSDNLRTRQ